MPKAKKLIQVYLNVDQHDLVQEAARSSGMSIAGQTRQLLLAWAKSSTGKSVSNASDGAGLRSDLIAGLLEMTTKLSELDEASSVEQMEDELRELADSVGRARTGEVEND